MGRSSKIHLFLPWRRHSCQHGVKHQRHMRNTFKKILGALLRENDLTETMWEGNLKMYQDMMMISVFSIDVLCMLSLYIYRHWISLLYNNDIIILYKYLYVTLRQHCISFCIIVYNFTSSLYIILHHCISSYISFNINFISVGLYVKMWRTCDYQVWLLTWRIS